MSHVGSIQDWSSSERTSCFEMKSILNGVVGVVGSCDHDRQSDSKCAASVSHDRLGIPTTPVAAQCAFFCHTFKFRDFLPKPMIINGILFPALGWLL